MCLTSYTHLSKLEVLDILHNEIDSLIHKCSWHWTANTWCHGPCRTRVLAASKGTSHRLQYDPWLYRKLENLKKLSLTHNKIEVDLECKISSLSCHSACFVWSLQEGIFQSKVYTLCTLTGYTLRDREQVSSMANPYPMTSGTHRQVSLYVEIYTMMYFSMMSSVPHKWTIN